jgi:hypothetical protein
MYTKSLVSSRIPGTVCGELSRIPRQTLKKSLDPPGVELKVRRELPEEWAELFLEAQHARGEEVRERHIRLEPQHVRDVPRAFHREHEIRWRCLVPDAIVFGTLKRIERAIDLET